MIEIQRKFLPLVSAMNEIKYGRESTSISVNLSMLVVRMAQQLLMIHSSPEMCPGRRVAPLRMCLLIAFVLSNMAVSAHAEERILTVQGEDAVVNALSDQFARARQISGAPGDQYESLRLRYRDLIRGTYRRIQARESGLLAPGIYTRSEQAQAIERHYKQATQLLWDISHELYQLARSERDDGAKGRPGGYRISADGTTIGRSYKADDLVQRAREIALEVAVLTQAKPLLSPREIATRRFAKGGAFIFGAVLYTIGHGVLAGALVPMLIDGSGPYTAVATTIGVVASLLGYYTTYLSVVAAKSEWVEKRSKSNSDLAQEKLRDSIRRDLRNRTKAAAREKRLTRQEERELLAIQETVIREIEQELPMSDEARVSQMRFEHPVTTESRDLPMHGMRIDAKLNSVEENLKAESEAISIAEGCLLPRLRRVISK